MIDIATLASQLDGLSLRAARREEVERWATNTIEGVPESVLPRVPAGAKAAVERLAKMCESIGPRILQTRAFGTLGDINWGGDSDELDDYLREVDMEALGQTFLAQAQISGIAAGLVRRDPDTEALLIEQMSGHLELVYAPGSTQHVVGLLQAWVVVDSKGRTTWSVRLYEMGDRRMTEWRGLEKPSDALKKPPASPAIERSPEYPDGAPLPRYVVMQKHPKTHQPYGEIDQLLPLIQSDWSSQLRGDRAEENTAFPQLKLIGQVDDGTSERSSAHILRVEPGGDAAFLTPGDLSQLHVHHDRKLERLREDAAMPGGFLGGNTPSGEAIREANQKFISSCQFFAKRLARLMSRLARDYAEAAGLDSTAEVLEVSVQINREFTKVTEIETITVLYDKGLLPFSAAVRAISVFVPTWSDDEIEEFILREERPLTAGSFLPTMMTAADRLPS